MYAAEYHIGCHQAARTAKATAVAPPIGRVRPLDAKNQGRKRDKKGHTEVRPRSPVADGFLKSTFLPKLDMGKSIQACTETGKTEKEIYTSLSRVAEHYGIEPMETQSFGFPYNIALAFWDTQKKLKQTSGNWDNLRLIQDGRKTHFAAEERYDTGTTLYYIPVTPLFLMLHEKNRSRTAQLLVSVCCYLYHIADVPYYRQEDSYLYWQYEMLKDWVQQDDETDETEVYMRELWQAEWIGERMEQKFFNRANLTFFRERLNGFKSRDAFDSDCLRLATDALTLYTDYPNESMYRNIRRREENDDDGQEAIGMEKYISFAAATSGWLYDNLTDCVNSEFNEYPEIEEPTIYKAFDGKPVSGNNLDFENRLFSVIDELCYLLNGYKTERK